MHVGVGDVEVDVVVDWAHKYDFVMNRQERGGYLCHSANAMGAGRHM